MFCCKAISSEICYTTYFCKFSNQAESTWQYLKMVSKVIEKAVAVQLTAYVSSRPPPTLRVTVSLQALAFY